MSVDYLRNWIINIVVTMIFVIFIEILMPSSSMRKYINFVLGLLVMLVILSPLLNIVSANFHINSKILEVSGAIDARDVQLQLDKIKKGQKEGIVRTYKQKLEDQIVSQITAAGLVEEVKAEVQIDERYETDEFGVITGIRVVVMENNNDNSQPPVQKVEIKVDITENQQATSAVSQQDQQLKEKISEYLIDLYNLTGDNIEVILQ